MPSNFRDKNGKDPFADEDGRNPYAQDGQEVQPADDEQELSSPTGDSLYAASAAEQYKYRPGDFAKMLPHRGGLILGVAIVGLVVGVVGIPVWYYWSLEMGVLALAATVTACVFALQDLRAMRLEAMDPSGASLTRWGLFVGVVGTAVAGISVVLLVGNVIFWMRQSSL